jgi:type IV secretion system protein VirD4
MSHPFGQQSQGGRLLPAAIIGAGAWYAMDTLGPVMVGGQVNWPSAIAGGILGISAISGAAEIFYLLADGIDHWIARTPTGLKASAGLAKSLREIKHDLLPYGMGPYWGSFKGKAVIAPYESSSYTIGPSGSGKTTRVVIPMILALKNVDKVVVDFKSELFPQLAVELRRRGENVIAVDLGNVFPERVGTSGEYNATERIADLFCQAGGLAEISDIVSQMCLQLLMEPANAGGDDKHWRDGSRECMLLAITQSVLVYGKEAHIGHANQLINDKQAFLREMQWVCGTLMGSNGEKQPPMPIERSPWIELHAPTELADFMAWYRGKASAMADLLAARDSKAAEGFLSGAQLALAPFNITTRASKVTRRSTFRFAELKEGKKPTTVFIMLDPNKAEAQAPVLGLIQWAMLYEIKRHPNKERPVYLIADEATNIPWSGLGSLMTWCRAYGLHLHLIFQNFFAFKQAHGEDTLQILLSECEIAQVLPGIRNQETLEMLEKMLGNCPVVGRNYNTGKDSGIGIASTGYSETERPVMTADEISRCTHGLLRIRQNRWMPIDLPSVAEIADWRKKLAGNPFHGNKPYLKRVKLRIGQRRGNPVQWLMHLWQRQ